LAALIGVSSFWRRVRHGFGAACRLWRCVRRPRDSPTDGQVFDAAHGRGVVTKLRLEFVSAVQVLKILPGALAL
jgi:hypothetical protein